MFPLLPRCLRPDVALPSVLLAVELLALLADHEALVPQLCSRSGEAGRGAQGQAGFLRLMGGPECEVDALSEACLLLLLYTYITSRPDGAATDAQWLHLEQEVRRPRPSVPQRGFR